MPLSNKATTPNGDLQVIEDCWLYIPPPERSNFDGYIRFNNLPDISDSKGASYNDETVIGRSMPIKTFSHGENRTISFSINFYTLKQGDSIRNLTYLRAIQSAVYPRDSSGALPYYPPPVCKLKCGKLLSASHLCVIMKSYSVKFPTDAPWDSFTKLPYRLEVSMDFDVVYSSAKLPGSEMIARDI